MQGDIEKVAQQKAEELRDFFELVSGSAAHKDAYAECASAAAAVSACDTLCLHAHVLCIEASQCSSMQLNKC